MGFIDLYVLFEVCLLWFPMELLLCAYAMLEWVDCLSGCFVMVIAFKLVGVLGDVG